MKGSREPGSAYALSGPLKGLFFACMLLALAALVFMHGVTAAMVFAALVMWLTANKKLPCFTLLLFIGALILRVGAVMGLHPPVQSDYLVLYETAQQILAGDFSFQSNTYFSWWAYQTGPALYEALLLSLWNSEMCIKLTHCVLSAGTVVLVYRTALGYSEKWSSRAVAVLYAVLPYPVLAVTVLSNQVPSAFFLLAACWLLVAPDTKRLGFARFPLAGAAAAIGNFLRAEGVIIMVAFAAWALFSLLERRGKDVLLRCGAGFLTLVAVYFALTIGASFCVKAAGVNKNGLAGDTLYKIVLGLDTEANGTYSEARAGAILATVTEDGPTAETKALEKELIRESLSQGPAALFRLFRYKLRELWLDDAVPVATGHFDLYPTNLEQLGLDKEGFAVFIRMFDRGVFFLMLLLAAAGLLVPWIQQGGKGLPDADGMLPYLLIFASLCAYLLVEVQPRYSYLPQIFVFLAAARFGRILPPRPGLDGKNAGKSNTISTGIGRK